MGLCSMLTKEYSFRHFQVRQREKVLSLQGGKLWEGKYMRKLMEDKGQLVMFGMYVPLVLSLDRSVSN